ncbi:MAG: tetratricopeptide repeat protein [Acidobacteria bacterium]|nr:tetratricopeptide repeat protein [Acidobacteriota bacterium]
MVFLLGLLLFAGADDPETLLKRAIAIHQGGDVAGSVALYQKYLAARPDSVLARSNLGAAYAKLARYDEAIQQYQVALKLQPTNAAVEMNLGLAFYKTGKKAQAAPIFEKVHRAAPKQMQPLLLLSDCWLAGGENKKVIAKLAPLAGNESELAVAYLYGTALIRDGQIGLGEKVIDRILRNGDSAEARLLLGTAKLQAQDFPAALVDIRKAAELNPDLPEVHSYLGQVLVATGDPDGATRAFRRALTTNPYDFTANLELGVLLKDADQRKEALRCFQRALEIRPGNLMSRYHIATIALSEGNADAARVELERIVKAAPSFTPAHVSLATAYYRLNRKADGDRERAVVEKLNAETQARQQKGVNVK